MSVEVIQNVNKIATPVQKKYVAEVIENNVGKLPRDIGQMKGDLIAYRGASDPVRLPIGNANKFLMADPTQPTGMRWADAGTGTGSTTLLKNASSATITAGTILAIMPSDQILAPREASKAQRYCGEKLYIAAEDAEAGADVECYHIPGTICQVLVSGTCSYGDPLLISSTAGIAAKVTGGVATVGYAMEDKSASATGLINVLLVENKAMGVTNKAGSMLGAGVIVAFSGGYDTDGFGLKYPNIKQAIYGDAPCGIFGNQAIPNGFSVMHYKQGEIVPVTCDKNRVDAGDWIVPSPESAGYARSGVDGYGIGYAVEGKAYGSNGKVKVELTPYGKAWKKYLYYQGNKCGDSWNKSFTFQTEGGTNYNMTRMTNDNGVMFGTVSGTGTQEVCLFAGSDAIDVTGYSKLIVRIGYTSDNLAPGSSSTIRPIFFGLANADVTTAKQSTISSLFSSAYDSITPVASMSALEFTEYELDISELSGSYNAMAVFAQDNISGSVSVYIQYVYLM